MPVASKQSVSPLIRPTCWRPFPPEQARLIEWMVSLCMLALGLFILKRAQGGLKCRWPLFPAHALGGGRFSWRGLSGFLLVNALVLLVELVAVALTAGDVEVPANKELFDAWEKKLPVFADGADMLMQADIARRKWSLRARLRIQASTPWRAPPPSR